MRIRRKKWARPELAACPYYIEHAEEYKGRWNGVFGDGKPLFAELGCGKGGFAAQAALKYPDVNWLALDIKSDMLGVARRTVEKAFGEAGREVSNLKLVSQNIEKILTSFDENDVIDRLYINFCNPWPKAKHKKRRLTHTRQLEQYRVFLRDGGEIRFKTDDDELFEESLEYFAEAGFEVKYLTRDLHADDYPDNIVTEHEKMFTEEGKTIKFLIAVKK
ncbi:MAG: tRNA (guanosine(46)-N7)-methyltransferase TrmB [Ruminococcus sp.]|nr:tRNA (guanosine(46)-N7)-methyltransferase TrmB [Ruminococcus sp.]MCM1380515.1 tRNA (guanosine(46)-N7)-methyltransferase TrmB [Muribaculaceae bacterium]MCM1480744.1 tRNA (guanosine(46)-N7)-methyltransferase TrmB [Muribaculaceae bacterium]